MKKYLIQGAVAKAVVEYDEDGEIKGITFEAGDEAAKQWLLTEAQVRLADLEAWAKRWIKKIVVIEMPTDLSFNAFWNLYDYKVGKKEKTVQLWTALNEAERTACLRAVPRYKQWLAQKPSMEKLYPQTFLSQRRWENEFRV